MKISKIKFLGDIFSFRINDLMSFDIYAEKLNYIYTFLYIVVL